RIAPLKSNGFYINFIKNKESDVIRRYITNLRQSKDSELKVGLLNFISPWKLCAGVSLGLAVRSLISNASVLCKAQPPSRIIQRRPNINKDSEKFDWNRFFGYLKPHKWLLLAAVAAAFTFFYIHLLALVGERVASQMKQDLFVSILNQDMSFFDQERTGELVNRLTVDVQDFKSSFKQTISGGLRAITQVVGSAVSLLVISPHLTGLTLVCVPSVVIGGTFIGSLLRKLSRDVQAQIEKATLVAEEAIANIRTVRAFAGEENEAKMFAEECETAADLSTELGLGVGLFQAGTNFMVLATMFLGGHLMSTGQMSAGDVMAFLVNAQTIQRSVAQISLLFGSVVKGVSAGGRVFEIYEAAKTANADEFIRKFPAGYETLVGERGMSLSGGQKQRIAIARAVLKNPPVMILDEATSALDASSEREVQRALESASKGRTVLVIAHRLSTIINADLIVVLHRGSIVEMGTHDQLKKQKGHYWNLIKQQDQGADDSRSL
ncbi:unnamed protein product, partial [Leptidea sinapis]